MAYPNRGLLKAAMGHYLTESARTALEALEPGEGVVEGGPAKNMPVVGPNQILDMPLFAKMPFLPGSSTMFYTTNLGEKLYQPSATFDLSDPYCKIMAPKYQSLHDPHLRAFYKRKDNLRRLKKAGHITDKNKVVCTLKEFNEYRQYLTSLKLEFEKNYIREQKMLEKQITKLQENRTLPEAVDTSRYRDWLLKEERPTIQEQENVMRNRYLELINQELEKLEQLAEENQRLAMAQDDKKKQGLEKRKQLLLRKKMEEEWRKKEVMLLMKIGADVKREARIDEQRRKSKEDKLKRKQAMLEKKMAHHLRKLQERFQREGLLPPGSMFPADALEDQGPEPKRRASLTKKPAAGSQKSVDTEKKSTGHSDSKDTDFTKSNTTGHGSQMSLAKAGKSPSRSRQSNTTLGPVASKSSLERKAAPGEKSLSKKSNRDPETGGEPSLQTSKVSFASGKEVVSMGGSGSGSNGNQAAATGSGGGSTNTKVAASASGGYVSNEGPASTTGSVGGEGKGFCSLPGGCGSKTNGGLLGGCGSKSSCCGSGGCGSKTSCCGSGGCGSKTSCCGSGGCGSKTSCCGSGRCGSKTSCCGSAGCGSKMSCCGSGRCGSKTSCCGSAEDGSKTSCCGCSQSGKGAGGYDSSGSSRHGNSSGTGKGPSLTVPGADQLHHGAVQTPAQVALSSAISQQTGSEASGKGKHKKRTTFLGESDGPTKERNSSKKRRVDRGKAEHGASTSQDNEDSESSYSAYLHKLLSNSDQSAIRESLKGKVSATELNSIIQNIMTWVVSAVTSILYPALTKFEERVRTKAYTISEESVLSSDNSSSCSTCIDDLPDTYVSLPTASTRKASCTDMSLKPTTSSPSELQTTLDKPSAKSSFTSFTKSTHMSMEGDHFRGVFKRGKTAVFLSPSKHSGLLSTTSSMRSSKSDSHICQIQKGTADSPEKPAGSHHNKHRHGLPKGLISKTETIITDHDGAHLGGGEYKPPHGPRDLGETICLRDLKSVLEDLKSHLTQTTAMVLEDIFKRILGDLGFSSCAVSITLDVLLETVAESLLGNPPGGLPVGTSLSRVASFVASDLVEKVLNTLHSTAQKKYFETISKDELSAGCKAMCIVATGKHTDPAFWRSRIPLSFEAVYGIAEEIVHAIIEKLKVFATSSRTKLSQLELCAKIKAIGIPLDQPIPPHTAESDAANAIVKDTIRKIVSKTVASSESHIIQYVEELIGSVLVFIQRQASQEGVLPTRESSILLQIINDVFNDLSVENLRVLSPSGKSRTSPAPETSASHEMKPGAMTTEKMLRKPFPLVHVPGMVVYSEAEVEGKEKRGPDGILLSVSKERRVLGVEEAPDKTRNEGFGLESRQRSRPKIQVEGAERKSESGLENFVQEAIFCSFEGQGKFPAGQTPGTEQPSTDGGWSLELALKKLEEDFKEGEHCPVVQIVRNLLNEIFQHIWTEHPIWPPATPPPSTAHLGITKHQPEEQPACKGQLSGPARVSEADVIVLTGDLVRTVFQRLSWAALADTPEARSRRSSLIFTEIFPPCRPTEAGKGPPTVHFRSPEMSFESGPTKEGAPEEPTRPSQPDLHNLPSKIELTSDLVQVCIDKLEAFVTSKVESQFCSDMQNLKTSTSANFPAALHQDLRQFLATHQGSLPSCLEEMFNSYNNLLLAEKTEQALPMSYSNLKTYAQEVAKRMLKSLKHGLDKEVEKILISPIIFSESIAASQIVNMVLAVFGPHERFSDLQHTLHRKESVLEKLFRKNPTYKKDIQGQIHHTVESFLNEIYQTILLDLGSSLSVSGSEKCPTPGVGGDPKKKDPSKPAVAQSDVSLVSTDLVDIMLEDLRSGLAAGLNTKGVLSSQLQSLLYDLLQKAVQPLKHLIGKHHTQKAEKQSGRILGGLDAKEHSSGREFSPGRLSKCLVNNVFRRLESFAEDKMESELSWREKQPLPHGQRTTEAKAGSCREKAKVAVQGSECNLRLCAEKLTCTLLKLFQKDLEREMLSCQNILPYEENASANEIVNDLLKVLSVQIALTESEVQKRVVKRIFKRKKQGLKGGAPLLARVEDVLHHLTQRIMGDLGHLPSFHNDSLFLSSESKASTYNGVTEALSQVHAGNVAGEIVDGVLDKMYSVVVDTLFNSSESKPELETSSSNPLTEAHGIVGKSDIQKMTMALSQLHPPPRTLGEELIQNVLNKIACFAASSLEEVLPMSMKQKPHAAFQYELQAGDGTTCRPRIFLDDSDNSLMKVTLSRSDLTVYAKDVVNKVLGSIIDELKNEDYHRAILRINTLSSEQISIASSVVYSVVQDLHTDDGQVSHLHKQASTRRYKLDGLPSTQMYFQWESTTRDGRVKRNSLFYEDFTSYLKQVLPKDGILRDIFEQQPLTDSNINETLKMLQVSENIVSELFMRIRDLEPSVCILKRTPGELSERLFCCEFKRAGSPGLFHSDSQAEIGSVARDVVASVFENVHKCLVCSFPRTQDKDGFWGRKDWAVPRGPGKPPKYRFTQPEFPFYNVSLKGSTDLIDKIAKETVECILLTLETFVARHFRRDFKCNFLEIVKFPLESLSFAQLTRSLDSLSRTAAETTAETFRCQVGIVEKVGGLPTLGSVQNFLDSSKLGSAITRECVETAIRQVQMLHSELSVYANNAVSGILEIIKRTLDRELIHKEATLFSSSSESVALSETISAMLDRCNESLTEITSELMVENLQLEMSGRAMGKDRTLVQDLVPSPMKTTTKRYRRVERDSFPPINVPGMVMYSEEETEVREEVPSKFPSVLKFSADWNARGAPEKHKGVPLSRSRPPGRRRQDRSGSRFKLDWLEEDWLPRQSSIPEGSILEKLFKKAAEISGPTSKAGLLHCSPPLSGPEGLCYSELCPLKLGHTAETIVNTLLCEFGLENDPMVQTGHYESLGQHAPLKDRPPLGMGSGSMATGPQKKKGSLLNLWEKRLSECSPWAEDSYLLFPRGGSTLLSRWESKHCLFGDRGLEKLKELELLGYAQGPDPYEIQLLANHIVLSVIKELLSFHSRDNLDSLPSWKQELLQSESKWLQERIWRSTYLSTSRKPGSSLDLFWEPLTQSVITSLLSSIADPSARQKIRNELSMFGSADGMRGPQSHPTNMEELASHISDRIMCILRDRNILQETTSRKKFSGRKVKSVHVPPLCLADFDDVYQPLVKEVDNLLSVEFGGRCKSGSKGKTGGPLAPHQQVMPRPISGASRGDCRGPGDLKGMTCLSMMGPLAQKSQRLSCVASNLDQFIRSLKTSESKHLVNKVLRIILDSLWPNQSQGGFMGPFADSASRNVMPYQDGDLPQKRPLVSSSACPHAYRLGNNMFGSSLGLSPKSVVLLDVVSEKLIRTLLDKCIMTEHFSGTFAFDEFPEDEQLCDGRKSLSEDEFFEPPGREMRAHKVDSCSSVFSYNIKYAEEPEEEVQAAPCSYESALDVLAHTLVKPVMTELSLSIEHPGHLKTSSKKSVGFMHPSSRKPHGPSFNRKHVARYGKGESYSSLPRSRKPEPLVPVSGRRPNRKGTRGRDRTVLETAVHHRTVGGRTGLAPASRSLGGRSFSSTTSTGKKSYHREVLVVSGHGDQPGFSTVYSAAFLEEVISQLLIKIFSSLRTKYDSDCIDLNEMNRLFVSALVGELNRAGVGVVQRAEEKAHLPRVDGHAVQRIVDSILQEFGFQLAADRGVGRDIDILAAHAAEVILMQILDYQLPPPLCRRLPQNAIKPVKAERIIHKIEGFIHFPAMQRKRQPPPTYITVLSQKYLERVINRLVAQIFPPCDSDSVILAPEQDKEEPCGINSDELSSYLMKEVMKSISKHKIWVARKDDQCRLHSEKETQRMIDSVYKNMLKKSGSQLAMQKDVKNRKNTFVDNMTSFIIQEITRQHLQTFLAKEELPSGTPDPDTLSENIVRTVLNSIGETSASCPGVFPTKFLEEMVSRVLSKILSTSDKKGSVGKGKQEDELSKVVKKLASSISLQFGKTTPPPGPRKGEEQSLGGPLTAVMDDVVDSVCNKIATVVPEEDFGSPTDNAVFESVKRLIGKGISDYLLHPLFSGDVPRVSPSSPSEGIPEDARDELQEVQEENENESPFNTFLSSGFLKDIISGLLSKIFPSTSPKGEAAAPWDAKKHPSDSDISKLSSQLLDDVRMKLLKHEIRVTKEAPQEQYEYSDEDVQNMTDSLCSKIIQKSGSLEAVQREVRKKSNSLIDRIAGFLVGDLLQKHVQPFVSEQELPTWDRAAAGDSMRGLEVSRTSIKPLDLRRVAQETRRSPSPTPSFGKIIRELFSNISQSFPDVPLGPSRENLGDTAFRVAKSVANVLSRTRLSVQESPVEELGSSPDIRGPSSWKLPDKVMSGLLSEDGLDSSSCHMTTMTFEEPADRPLHSARSPDLAEAKCLIQKKLMVGPAGPLARAPVPYTTVLSYPVLEAIVDRLLVRIFPDAKDGPFDPDLCERLAQLRKAIMVTVLKQAIWISTYGSESSISEEAMERMVESVYCDVLHEVLLQQPLQGDRESLSNLYVTKIACFIVNEMFKYHLGSEEERRPMAASPRSLPASCVTVFPCSLLEVMLNQLLMKIFPDPQSIAADSGSLADFSESDLMEMATNLKSYVITEISAHEIRLENNSQRVPDMDQETEEDIACSVYNQILEKSASQNQLQESLTSRGNATVSQLANLLIREILNFHLHPFLSGSDPSSGEATPHQQEHQPFSHHIYSAVFLEDVVVAFFCKMLSSPSVLTYSKDTNLSEGEMRDLVIELVNALVCEFKALQVKVIQSEEENLPFPQVIAEDVVQITDSIYERLAQDLGSDVAIFKAFQHNGSLLAEKLALLIVDRVSEYQFQPLFTGDTSSYLFSFLDAETIVDRVETILPETATSASSNGMFKEMFSKILQRIFPSWSPQRSEEMEATMGDAGSSPMEHMEKQPTCEADRTLQNLMENICKTICPKSGSPKRKYGSGTAEEPANFTGRPRADRHTLESPSPPSQTLPPPRLSPQPAGWTVQRVKLGDAEPQSSQEEDKGSVYSSTFLKDLFSGLVSKLLSSTASVCLLDKKESEAEPPVQTFVESILKAFAKSPVKVLQMPKGGQTSSPVGQKEMAKIIHASLCGILQDRGGGSPICTDKDSDHALAEKLANSIKKEILGYQIQGTAAKSPPASASKPFEFGEMARRVLTEVRRTNTQSQKNVPSPLLVSQRFIHDILDALLTNILPLPDKATDSDNSEDQFAEFDFIHMKLLSKVMAEIGKDKNTKVQYLEKCQPQPKASQTVANSVYGNLVPEFGDVSGLEKCIKAGCTILFERIADCVIKEISGDQIQTYFSEELNRQQEAEVESSVADDYEATAEPPEGQAILHSHLRGLSSIVIEEVAAKLLSKMFHSIPMDDIESSSISAMKEVAKKILDSMQGLISKKKLRVWQQGDMEDLGLEDSRAVGEVVDSVYTDIIKHSGSETSLYDELTNENEDFVKRVACVMVSEISRHDFPPFPEEDEEEELPHPSASIKLETDKIIRKFLSDMELEKAKKEQQAAATPTVPVLFMEEILSRFLTKIVLAQQELDSDMEKSWSRTEVNSMADQLKVSVEKEMSKNKISLVAPEIREEKLAPEDEAKVDRVVHSVYSNVLEISGSHQEMFKDVTTIKAIFPEQVASIIINEVSSCSIKNPFAENIENETLSALELDRIVSKVIAQVGSHTEKGEEEEEEEEDASLSEGSAMPFSSEDAPLLSDTEDIPVKIVPYVGHKALKIDPDIISDHLAVLSIKTEPLEKLERACLSKVGMSLMELRRASASGKNLPVDMGAHDPHKKKERRPSLDMAGRLDVKPREAVCRNSFQSLMRPDITKVELLRDVESKQDLIVRLVAHDISDSVHRGLHHLDEQESEERVLREDRSVFFEAPFMPPPQDEDKEPEPPSEPLLPKTSSIIIRKRSISLSKCCPALTASASGLIFKGKPNAPPLPQIEITPMSRVPSIRETAASTPFAELSPAVSVTNQSVQTSWTDVLPEADDSEEAEKTMEEGDFARPAAVVDMHLTRDTETTSGAFEITSVYQDKKVREALLGDHSEDESESGKGVKSISSEEAIVPVQKSSSVLEKVSSALSRVFSRTSASNLTKTAPAPD